MNVAYFLTPRNEVSCICDDFTLRQGLEKMRRSGYTALPVVTRQNKYVGTISEGDFLWHLMDKADDTASHLHSVQELERMAVRDVLRIDHNPPVRITVGIDELLMRSMNQNFIPVIDDLGSFIGIVTRKDIIRYFAENIVQKEQSVS